MIFTIPMVKFDWTDGVVIKISTYRASFMVSNPTQDNTLWNTQIVVLSLYVIFVG